MQDAKADPRNEPRPKTGEAPLFAGEVFYSRTDERGIIKSGNCVFQRVAQYEWSELIGAPHNIIRHPDMPKGVFWYMWDRIQNGDVIGCYVKNRSKDGLYYWVFAIVAQTEGGFLSARMKPTSGILKTVESVYAKMRDFEKGGGTPEKSADLMLESLAGLGFENYDEFISDACSEEILAECRELQLPPDRRIEAAKRNLKLATKLANETELLVAAFDGLRIVPHNLRLAASRLEPTGGPISTLSRNYGEMSRDMLEWIQTHVVGSDSNFSAIRDAMKRSMLMECATGVLHRCNEQLSLERLRIGEKSVAEEQKALREVSATYACHMRSAKVIVSNEATRIQKACEVLGREILGLNATRVACKIENARLGRQVDGLEEIVTQFGVAQGNIEGRLANILEFCEKILNENVFDETISRTDVGDKLIQGEAISKAHAENWTSSAVAN